MTVAHQGDRDKGCGAEHQPQNCCNRGSLLQQPWPQLLLEVQRRSWVKLMSHRHRMLELVWPRCGITSFVSLPLARAVALRPVVHVSHTNAVCCSGQRSGGVQAESRQKDVERSRHRHYHSWRSNCSCNGASNHRIDSVFSLVFLLGGMIEMIEMMSMIEMA